MCWPHIPNWVLPRSGGRLALRRAGRLLAALARGAARVGRSALLVLQQRAVGAEPAVGRHAGVAALHGPELVLVRDEDRHRSVVLAADLVDLVADEERDGGRPDLPVAVVDVLQQDGDAGRDLVRVEQALDGLASLPDEFVDVAIEAVTGNPEDLGAGGTGVRVGLRGAEKL